MSALRGSLYALTGDKARETVCQEVMRAPIGHEVIIREPTRTLRANARMWAMLSDVSRAAPEGRRYSPEVWKALFMSALGHELRWVPGLEGEPIPCGFRTSRLSKRQMGDLLTSIAAYGDQHAVPWSEPMPENAR